MRVPRFIVIGAMRSGTSVINESLELHPSLNVAYEVFHCKSSVQLTNVPHIRDILEDIYGGRHLNFSDVALLGGHPRFPDDVGVRVGMGSFDNCYDLVKLAERIFEEYNGFKILYDQVKRNNDLWNYLQEQPDLKVIHTLRDNYVDSLVSLIVAYRSTIWQLQQWGTVKPDPKIEIDPEDAKTYFEYLDFAREHYLSMFEGRSLVIRYEQIQDWQSLMKQLQDFLGVEYVDLFPKYQRRIARNHYSMISNLPQLASFFRNTKWRSAFEVAVL